MLSTAAAAARMPTRWKLFKLYEARIKEFREIPPGKDGATRR